MTDDLQLADLIPDATGVGARIAYLQLLQFQELSALVTDAPALEAKQDLGRIANLTLQRHEAAIETISRDGVDGIARMGRCAAELDEFATRVAGRDWDERMVTCHLAAGILRDFYATVVDLLGDAGEPLRPLIDDREVQHELHAIITERLGGDPHRADRLAMWGRRITGDSLLAVRRALGFPDGTPADDVRDGAEEVVESLAAELMAEHSRRMNALGLAA